jgi:hypothetical protein
VNYIALQVALHFSKRPGDELTLKDIQTKWKMPPDSSRKPMDNAVLDGWFYRERRLSGGRHSVYRFVYSAGPKLLKEIGYE